MKPLVRDYVEDFLTGIEADWRAELHDVRPEESAARRFIIDAARDALAEEIVACPYCEAPDACECDDA